MIGKIAAKQVEIRGVVYSDLGQARDFMSVDWVRRAMREKLGFEPYPGTLNLRMRKDEELEHWQRVKEEATPVLMPSPDPAFCDCRYFMGFLSEAAGRTALRERIAVVVPEVKDYPEDKIEVIAGRALKATYSIRDDDELTLVFECSV